MTKNNYFQFKQFRIMQEKSAMKVGTDGILLGSWASVERCKHILDVGTGTGLVALMLAQRSPAKITAVEIEADAAAEAIQNVLNSPWKNNIEIVHNTFQEFAIKTNKKYDLIVSNPPFFSNAIKASGTGRNLARHNDTLPFADLITYSTKLLSEIGLLTLILPQSSGSEFENLAAQNKLFLLRKMEIQSKCKKAANRVLLEFSKNSAALKKCCLIVYDESGNYSEAYKKLTKNFYLNF